jgi:hypothetical protein
MRRVRRSKRSRVGTSYRRGIFHTKIRRKKGLKSLTSSRLLIFCEFLRVSAHVDNGAQVAARVNGCGHRARLCESRAVPNRRTTGGRVAFRSARRTGSPARHCFETTSGPHPASFTRFLEPPRASPRRHHGRWPPAPLDVLRTRLTSALCTASIDAIWLGVREVRVRRRRMRVPCSRGAKHGLGLYARSPRLLDGNAHISPTG